MAVYISFQPKDFFNSVLYTGNGSTQSITGVGFQPDFIWIKCRNDTRNHQLQDSVRNDFDNIINSDSDGAQGTFTDGVTAVGSDGFSVGARAALNTTSDTLVSWNWKMGTTSGLSGGTITPSGYSISTTAGQSVIAWTGTGSAGTIPHGLGVTPKMIIVKETSHATNWAVYHSVWGNTKFKQLNTTAVLATTSNWNDTSPTSSLFSVGGGDQTNTSGRTYVAYCFAPVRGYCHIGSYIGNGYANGPFVYTGFKPGFVMIVRTDSTYDWTMFDNKRIGYNPENYFLWANSTAADGTTDYMNILSNGYKIIGTTQGINGGTSEYVYIAFAANPIVSSNDIPGMAR